jgi:hypothetical protein
MSEVLETFAKAPSSKVLLKAFGNTDSLKNVKFNDPKSAIIDPFSAQGVQSLRQKPTSIPYSTLRRMAQVLAIAAIINTRLNQVARFARRPRYDGDMGFKIALKDRDAKMSEAQRKQAFDLEEFFLRTGAIPNKKRKDNFDSFLRKVVRDTLTLDVVAWENVPNLKGGLAELWAVDGTTIELVAGAPVGEDSIIPVYEPMTKRGQTDAGNIAYVQKIDGQTIAEYTEDELTFAIRNPRTDIMLVDFGMSELETLIEIITGIMNGVRYNTSYFSDSHMPQGVLEIIGKYKDDHLEAFKRHWKTLTSGAAGKWAVPVMALENGQGFKFTPFKNNNRDMEFNEFLEFLFNIACAVYQIDPNEVGFKSWTSKSGGMTQSDNTEVKMEESKDKGFVPLMQFLANTFNSQVVDRIDDTFSFEWVGLDEEDEEQKWARIKTKIDTGVVTVAQIRKEEDMEEILDDEGKPAKWTQAPGNTTLIQVFMADVQAAQQEKQMAQQQEMQNQQSAIEGSQQQASADDQHKKQLEVMDKQHQQSLEVKKLDQDHQAKMADKQAQVQGKQTEQQHLNDMSKMDKQHSQAKDMAEYQHDQASEDGTIAHKRGLETKKLDQQHQLKVEALKAKNKDSKLKKSLEDDEDLEITIDWTEY